MYLIDTNVVAELRKVKRGAADPNVAAWNDSMAPDQAYLSVITILELEKGILQIERRDAPQGILLRRWMDEHVMPAFSGRILGIDAFVARRCARLHIPDPRPERDALIAATALVYSMAIVTRNVADFDPTGVEILNPWEWQPGYVTLHAEMQQILHGNGNVWMTSVDLAQAVSHRDRYHRRDQARVLASQVAARARIYDQMFECESEGSRLRIRTRR